MISRAELSLEEIGRLCNGASVVESYRSVDPTEERGSSTTASAGNPSLAPQPKLESLEALAKGLADLMTTMNEFRTNESQVEGESTPTGYIALDLSAIEIAIAKHKSVYDDCLKIYHERSLLEPGSNAGESVSRLRCHSLVIQLIVEPYSPL